MADFPHEPAAQQRSRFVGFRIKGDARPIDDAVRDVKNLVGDHDQARFPAVQKNGETVSTPAGQTSRAGRNLVFPQQPIVPPPCFRKIVTDDQNKIRLIDRNGETMRARLGIFHGGVAVCGPLEMKNVGRNPSGRRTWSIFIATNRPPCETITIEAVGIWVSPQI